MPAPTITTSYAFSTGVCMGTSRSRSSRAPCRTTSPRARKPGAAGGLRRLALHAMGEAALPDQPLPLAVREQRLMTAVRRTFSSLDTYNYRLFFTGDLISH